MQTPQHDKKLNRNIVFPLSTVIFAGLVLFFYIISNLPSISEWVRSIVSVFAPLIIGLSIAYLCSPLLRFLERKPLRRIRSWYLRRMLSIILTYLLIILIIAAVGLLMVPQLIESIRDLVTHYNEYIANAVGYINGLINRIASRFPTDQPYVEKEYLSLENVQQLIQQLINTGDDMFEVVLSRIQSYGSKFISGVSTLLVSLFISFYVLASKERLLALVKRLLAALFNEKHYQFICNTASLADKTFGSYFSGVILDSIIVGIVSLILFSLCGIPYAVIISIIIAATNVIPFFGPIIGAVPSAFIVFIADTPKTLLFVILIFVMQQLDGNILAPKILGMSTGVSSLCIITAISIMGNLWGVFGMIVGVPLFAVILSLLEQFVNKRLEGKGISNDLNDYYPEETLDTEDKPHVSFRYYVDTVRYTLSGGKRRGLAKPDKENYLRVSHSPGESSHKPHVAWRYYWLYLRYLLTGGSRRGKSKPQKQDFLCHGECEQPETSDTPAAEEPLAPEPTLTASAPTSEPSADFHAESTSAQTDHE